MQCVFCDKTEGLNTQFSISLEEGKKVTVSICDEHAEDATIKTAKAAFLDKKKKIDDIMAQAKALGLELSSVQPKGSLLLATVPEKPQKTTTKPQQVVEDLSGDDVISTEVLDQRGRRGMTSIGGGTAHGHVASHASHNIGGVADQLPEGALKGKVKMTMVEGREGIPIGIPEKRVDGLGTTRIRISKIENDNKLQNRFKKMADHTMHGGQSPDLVRGGYNETQSSCPLCRGDCTIKQSIGGVVQETMCPKCNGAGVISVY